MRASRPARSTEPVLALVGPTATGKTEAGISLATAMDAEIVSIDSTTVYRGLDAGTAKPNPEQRATVRHHLIDILDPGEPFSVAEFQRLGRLAFGEIRREGRIPLLVGGSGLYYRALVDSLDFPGTVPSVRRLLEAEARIVGARALHARLAELDPEASRRIEASNVRRTIRALEVMAVTGRPFSDGYRTWDRFEPDAVRAAGVLVPKPALHRRIEQRAESIMPPLIQETRALMDQGHEPFINASQIIGYAEAATFLRGSVSQEEALATFIRRTKALARRQMAWFRRDPRIRWFTAGEGGAAGIAGEILSYLAGDRVEATVSEMV